MTGTPSNLLEAFSERKIVFQHYGYDIDVQRDFILAQARPLRGRVLEVGTGKGHFTVSLAREKVDIVSVDLDPDVQAIARAALDHLGLSGRVDLVPGNAQALGFSDRSFDAVVSVNAFHHFQDSVAVVDEMIRVVSPCGKMVLSDFSEKGFELVAAVHKNEGRTHPVCGRPLKDIAAYCREKGFRTTFSQSEWQDIWVVLPPQ